jgi:putative DNA primase/helicase
MYSEQNKQLERKVKRMNVEKLNGNDEKDGKNGPKAEALNGLNELNWEGDELQGLQQLHGDKKPGDKEPEQSKAVNGTLLLDELEGVMKRFVVLPKFAAETLALWVVHTYAFELRDVSTYLGIESPEKRCGKTTLLGILSKLVNRPVAAANISSSAFFRVIEEMQPTLLIDEADTFLRGNEELRGILNAGYTRETAYVIRMQNGERRTQNEGPLNRLNELNELHEREESRDGWGMPEYQIEGGGRGRITADEEGMKLARFSCWCPKVMAAIGRLPETLADRCIVIRMERKRMDEECERLRSLETGDLRQRCARFVKENEKAIVVARPKSPESLNDRAADIWEPLLAVAELAGGSWPDKARRAADGLAGNAQGRSEIGSLLLDIFGGFAVRGAERLLSRDLVAWLNRMQERPWMELPGLRSVEGGTRREVTELWLSRQLRPYGVRPKNMRDGERVGKGYLQEEMVEVFRRYVPRAEVEAFKADVPV